MIVTEGQTDQWDKIESLGTDPRLWETLPLTEAASHTIVERVPYVAWYKWVSVWGIKGELRTPSSRVT